MNVLNILWGFSTGGIGKCFMTYNKLGEADAAITVHPLCIDILSRKYDRSGLSKNKIDIISLKNIFDLSWIKEMRTRIRTVQPDIIFCHGFNGPVITWLVSRLYNLQVPVVCTYHGLYHPPTGLKKILSPVYNSIPVMLYRTYAKKIITVEDYSKNELHKKGVPLERLVTVHNGIPDNTHGTANADRTDRDCIKLCTISRLDAVKGLDYLIRALPEVKSKVGTGFKLFIVGDGTEYEALRKLTARLGLKDNIVFQGYQPRIEKWLHAADIFLLPSLHEYHSIALLEAMRAGKAIITTRVGGNGESIRDGIDGIIIPPKDPKALASAIIRLIEHPELKTRYAQNARDRYVNNFTETRMLTNLASVLNSIG